MGFVDRKPILAIVEFLMNDLVVPTARSGFLLSLHLLDGLLHTLGHLLFALFGPVFGEFAKFAVAHLTVSFLRCFTFTPSLHRLN